jgi:hypothetical protein
MNPPIIRKRALLLSAAAGFLVPIFWGVLGFILFNISEGPFSRAYWDLVYISCPFWWILPDQYAFWLMSPLTAILYAVIYSIIRVLFSSVVFLSKRTNS